MVDKFRTVSYLNWLLIGSEPSELTGRRTKNNNKVKTMNYKIRELDERYNYDDDLLGEPE